MIAEAARTLPHTLRRVDAGDDTLAELEMPVGYDDDLAGEVNRVSNRIRGLLTQIHPPLERALGPTTSASSPNAYREQLTHYNHHTGVPGARPGTE